ncbi:MAG: small basic protein [Candidatus Omnitrophota bacterium]|nr:small basic protein [Candidatus Omnitrophota bacterium]
MSQHPSLSSSDKDKQHRSVLKRYEKIRILKDKEKWKEGDSVYGLAKVKVTKFKIKKEKAAVVEGTEAAGPGTEAAPGAVKAAVPGKAQAPAKGAAAKEGQKPLSAGVGKKEAK